MDRTRVYLEKYGPAKAVILARFVPVVRTLMNPLAGVAEMDGRVFTLSNLAARVALGGGRDDGRLLPRQVDPERGPLPAADHRRGGGALADPRRSSRSERPGGSAAARFSGSPLSAGRSAWLGPSAGGGTGRIN